ncbi:hypothetical protein ZOSMA_193G00350 [Zostera marina]|uniref:Uncharacterized protein n=1 Tax=Zostera marina TaxID=29655 RepID=A0A0K9PPC3_ZOSMR|nr:hypothetical protein ZOSMA_193G00350 [Zostera marina]
MDGIEESRSAEDLVKESLLERFQQNPKQEWNQKSIYRIPCSMRDLNNKAYQPRVVSIGPYHNGNQHLRPMEEHKYRALRHLLAHTHNITVEDLVAYFKNDQQFMEKVMVSYSTPIDSQWKDTDAFTFLMVLDGCFLLELFLSSNSARSCETDYRSVSDWCYDDDDPIFSVHAERRGVVPYVKLDMLLVENQIPLIVLEKLASFVGLVVNLNDLIRSFYGCWYREQDETLKDPPGLHVLDVYRKGRLLVGEYTGWTVPKSAKELDEHGVRFIRSSGDIGIGSFKDVSFGTGQKRNKIGRLYDVPRSSLSQKIFFPLRILHGYLHLPLLIIDETTEPILLNLMAFELLHLGIEERDMAVTKYVFLMSSLIRSEEDVRCLRNYSILFSSPQKSNGSVVSFFAGITRNVVMRDDGRNASKVNQEILELCRKKVNRLLGTWSHNFGSELRAWLFTLVITYSVLFSLVNALFNIIRYIQE